jgi:hypothetical protein
LQLSWTRFEDLCLALAQRRGYQAIEHLGATGRDAGRDIVALDGQDRVVIQCKRVAAFGPADGVAAVERLRDLGADQRPDRLILMLACTVSTQTRAAIRAAWARGEGSCEIAGCTELEVEIRRHPELLNTFFSLPAEPADGNEPRLLARLRRLEEANSVWASSMGTPFDAFVRSLRQLDSPFARLEAHRVLERAAHRGKGRLVYEKRALSVCDQLATEPLFEQDWRLRRMLAQLGADVLVLAGPRYDSISSDFIEARRASLAGALLLAETATIAHGAAAAIGRQTLVQLLRSSQPQVPWQLLRRWAIVGPIVSDIDVNDGDAADVECIRRVATVARLSESLRSRGPVQRVMRRAIEGARGTSDSATSFSQALQAWAHGNTGAAPDGDALSVEESFTVRDLLSRIETEASIADRHVHLIGISLDFRSLELDLQDAIGATRRSALESPEGRYRSTECQVAALLRHASDEQGPELLHQIAGCADEGVRWSLARKLRDWWSMPTDHQCLARLLADPHPWVSQEALQQVVSQPAIYSSLGVANLAALASTAVRAAEADGWPTYELQAVVQRALGAAVPTH